MRDKKHDGTIDQSRDHHMINGRLVPVVETAPNRSQRARSAKRQKTAAGGKAAEDASKSHA